MIRTENDRVVTIISWESVVAAQNFVNVTTVQTTESSTESGQNPGGLTGFVVEGTHYPTVQLQYVTLMGINLAVTMEWDFVEKKNNFVPVTISSVRTTSLPSGGENLEVHRCGGMTVDVEDTIHFLMVKLLDVTTMEISRAVSRKQDGVETQNNFVLVG